MTLATDVTRHHAEIPALDGFRAMAIGIVMLSHVGLQHIVPGQFGVTLFFFLSGYLITTLLRREIAQHGGIDFRRFYLRRAVRILPPMYVTIAFIVLLSLAGVIRPINGWGLPFDFAFLTNYFPLSGIPIGLWSLAVEEHFYLAFPALLGMLVLRRFSFAQCAAVCLTLCALVLAVRFVQAGHLADPTPITLWTHTRIDSILYGSILGLWNNPVADERDVLPKRVAGYAVAAALLLPAFLIRDEMFRQTLRYTMQGLGLLVLFNTAIRDRGLIAQLLNNVITRQIAVLSYTLYLIHSALILAFVPDNSHPFLPVLAAFACSFGYALLMHRWIEKPLNRWRRQTEAAMSATDPTLDTAEAQPAVAKSSRP